jgi:hypothetical protein
MIAGHWSRLTSRGIQMASIENQNVPATRELDSRELDLVIGGFFSTAAVMAAAYRRQAENFNAVVMFANAWNSHGQR